MTSTVNPTPPTCAVLGASGLVGRQLVGLLSESQHYAEVRVVVRRLLEPAPRGVTMRVVDFDALNTHGAAPSSDQATSSRELLTVTHVFCCLGTTIKVAGSEAAFRRVDLDYPLAAARLALEAGARQFIIVTAVGADARSAVLYNRVKGELENALRSLPFPDGLTVLHPSLLLGERRESRPGEAIASMLMRATGPLFRGPLERFRAIDATRVAQAMRRAAETPSPGYRVLEGKSLFAMAR